MFSVAHNRASTYGCVILFLLRRRLHPLPTACRLPIGRKKEKGRNSRSPLAFQRRGPFGDAPREEGRDGKKQNSESGRRRHFFYFFLRINRNRQERRGKSKFVPLRPLQLLLLLELPQPLSHVGGLEIGPGEIQITRMGNIRAA